MNSMVPVNTSPSFIGILDFSTDDRDTSRKKLRHTVNLAIYLDRYSGSVEKIFSLVGPV